MLFHKARRMNNAGRLQAIPKFARPPLRGNKISAGDSYC